MFTDLVTDLDQLLSARQSVARSGSCSQACSLAQTATNEICAAADLAAIALAACPTSIYAADAEYYASTECQTSTLFTVPYTCMGAAGQSQALGWLDSAKRRSLRAWSNASLADTKDGCSESVQTAFKASDSYVNFHNARFHMSSCY